MQEYLVYNLKSCRVANRLTQSEVAAKTGLHVTAITHFESGRRMPTVKNLCKLGDCFGVNIEVLLGRV